MKSTRKCFYRGKFFESTTDMLEYAQNWENEPFDIEWFKMWVKHRLEEAEMNIHVNPKITNKQMYSILLDDFVGTLKPVPEQNS